MLKAKVALVAVASHFESGGERAEGMIKEAQQALGKSGLSVEVASKTVWDPADALEVIDQFQKSDPDLLIIIHASWVQDSLQYLFVNKLKIPLILWAVPYTETFSIGCVQHFGSILWDNGISYKFVYGLPDEQEVIAEVKRHAAIAKIYKDLAKANIALIGPRQTWRVAGPQDMTVEEWDLSMRVGATIVHIEMDELLQLAEVQKKEDAVRFLKGLREKKKLGESKVEEDRLIYASKVYLGVRQLLERYRLDAAAAECYPQYGGVANLPSSWLADEGIVLDTEGDIGHTLLAMAMSWMSDGPVALGEVGSMDTKENCLCLAHEGSSAQSLAQEVMNVRILPGGEKGTLVGFPFRAMPEVTVANICGRAGCYRIFMGLVESLPISEQEWVSGGSKFMAKLRFGADARTVMEKMLEQGADHHLLLARGNLLSDLGALCDLLKMEKQCV